MSNFGAKLAELLERKEIKQAELSRGTQISDAMISKWVNGLQTYVSTNDLAKLSAFISPDHQEQAELIKAHLLDEISGPAGHLIDVHILGAANVAQECPISRKSPLPLNLRRAFDLLERESVNDPDVRAVILGLASVLTHEDVPPDEPARPPTPVSGPVSYRHSLTEAQQIAKAAGDRHSDQHRRE